ncbi:transcription factor IIIA-like [Cloeon dipterum]|uniref:transcription factor IIIA-like n=1 Tax=Cloeon dipterum TaxID=197152 RepID=UPI00322010FC
MKEPGKKKSDVCKQHKCNYPGCSKVFNRPYRLKEHISASHVGEKQFTCPEFDCQKAYASKYKLHLHLKNHNSGALPLGNCTSGNLDPLASKANEAASPTKASALVKCHIPYCNKVYANKYSMMKHVKTDHILAKSSLYDCASCGSRFKTHKAIKDHWHTHLGLTPYSCKFCPRVFSCVRLLKKHVWHHNVFKCNTSNCPDWILGKENFRLHKQQCHSIGYVTCHYCNRQFERKCHLSRHIKYKHFPRIPVFLKCTHCDRVYNHKRNLDMHIKIKHKLLRIPCQLCEKTYTTNQRLAKHMAMHEPGYAYRRVYPRVPNRKTRKDAGVPRIEMAKLLAGI